MTAVTAPTEPRHFAPHASRTAVILGVGALVAATSAIVLPDATWSRVAVALIIGVVLLAVALEDEVDGILAVIGYLIAMGLVRRLVSTALPDPPTDPLLLVGPSLAAAMAVMATARGALKPPTALVVMTGAFAAITVAAVLNTQYTSLQDNAGGLLFWTVPLLWFPVGRALVDDGVFRRLLRVVAVAGAGSCVLGLYQVLVELPPWDQHWFETRGYIALGINGPGTLHPWGWSPSATEFAQVAAIVMVVCALELRDAWRARARGMTAIAAVGFGVSALALGLCGVRTAQLLAGLAVLVVVLASGRVRPLQAIAAAGLVALLVVGSVRVFHVEDWYDSGVSGLVRRSLLLFADPFGSGSTINSHLDLTEYSLRGLDDRPLGGGTAQGSPWGALDQVAIGVAENDLGNAALAFGFVGVALFLGITGVALHHAWRRARGSPTIVTLAALGILVASLRFWWTGSHYATAMLVWLTIGHVDRPEPP